MHTDANTADNRGKERVENTSPERQSSPCTTWEVLGQKSSKLNVLCDPQGSAAASSTTTAHRGAKAASAAARKKNCILCCNSHQEFRGTGVPRHRSSDTCCSSSRHSRSQLEPHRRFPLSNARRGSVVAPQPLRLTAPGLAPNPLQGSFQLGLGALFCRFRRRGEAGDRELLKQQDLLQPVCRALGGSKRPCHI